MFRVRWILVGFLLLPIAELAVFLAIAAKIGALATLTILLATSLVGAAVIRHAGGASRLPLRTRSREDVPPPPFTVICGVLLLVPGFLTDIAAVLLLIPAVQRYIIDIIAKLLRGLGEPHREEAPIVELDRGEWHRLDREDGAKASAPPPDRHSCPPAPAVLATPPESGPSASRVKEER